MIKYLHPFFLTVFFSVTKQFFEIHQYLGNAIAIVIKLKTQIKKSGNNDVLQQVDTARSEKSPVKELKREDSIRSQASEHSSEYGDDADSTHRKTTLASSAFIS